VAHQVEQMFSVKQVPWHGLGNVIQQAPSIEEGIKMAGLDWKVGMQPMYLQDQNGSLIKADTRAVMRDLGDGTFKKLGEVGKLYTPLQNTKAFEFFQPFIASGEASLETAGSLDGGKKIWVLAKLNRNPLEIVKGDTVEKFLLLTNRHDGIASAMVGFNPVRVVCANTLAAAISAKDSQLLRVRHTAKVELGLEKIRETINMANAQFEATGEMYKAMARMGVSESDIKKFVKQVFYPEVIDSEITQRQETRLNALTDDITRLFETGFGNDLKGVRGTMWGLYNGVTQYLSHEATDSNDRRFDSLWFGNNKTVNAQAMKVAVSMSTNGAA